MKGIILAAGRGSRMGMLTDDTPKCLTELAGKTLLEWQIQAMRDAGIQDVVIVGGYQRQHLEKYGCRIVENVRWNETNMVSSLMCAESILEKETSVVSYSDIVYHPDAAKRLACHHADIAISYDTKWEELWEMRFDDPLSDAETFRQTGGYLSEIGSRASSVADIHGQYMGLLKFSPQGWKNISGLIRACDVSMVDRLDMTAILNKLLGAEIPIQVVPVDGRWCEVDTERDLEMYLAKVNATNGASWSHDWRW